MRVEEWDIILEEEDLLKKDIQIELYGFIYLADIYEVTVNSIPFILCLVTSDQKDESSNAINDIMLYIDLDFIFVGYLRDTPIWHSFEDELNILSKKPLTQHVVFTERLRANILSASETKTVIRESDYGRK